MDCGGGGFGGRWAGVPHFAVISDTGFGAPAVGGDASDVGFDVAGVFDAALAVVVLAVIGTEVIVAGGRGDPYVD
jgi:hypothetical protein